MVRVCKGLWLGFVMTLQDIQESLIHGSRRTLFFFLSSLFSYQAH